MSLELVKFVDQVVDLVDAKVAQFKAVAGLDQMLISVLQVNNHGIAWADR